MSFDSTGLKVTAKNQNAIDAFENAVLSYFRFGIDIGEKLKKTFSHDDNIFLGLILKGYFMLLMGNRVLIPKAQKVLLVAKASLNNVNDREKLHYAALEAWCKLDLTKTTYFWQRIVNTYPQDALAIKMLHYTYFYLGDVKNLKLSVENTWSYWEQNKDNPYYGFLLSLKAFGLEENGFYEKAKDLALESYSINKNDAWAIHTVVHVYEMTGKANDGIKWIEEAFQLNSWNNFKYHLQWHKALMLIDNQMEDKVLNFYDNSILNINSDEYLDLTNNISLLLRLEILGINVGNRWEYNSTKVQNRLNDNLLAFVDIHFMICLCFTNRKMANEYLKSIKKYHENNQDTYSNVSKNLSYSLCKAIIFYMDKKYKKSIFILENLILKSYLIGGSNAQRDIFELILFDSLLKTNNQEKIKKFLQKRVIKRPQNIFINKMININS